MNEPKRKLSFDISTAQQIHKPNNDHAAASTFWRKLVRFVTFVWFCFIRHEICARATLSRTVGFEPWVSYYFDGCGLPSNLLSHGCYPATTIYAMCYSHLAVESSLPYSIDWGDIANRGFKTWLAGLFDESEGSYCLPELSYVIAIKVPV